MSQQSLSDYERKKPTFEWHKAILLQILHECKKVDGLTDTEIYPRFSRKIWEAYERKGERPERVPTIDNRLRDLASENKIVRIKGFDGLKHNYHPDVFLNLPSEVLERFYMETDIAEWKERLTKNE